MSRVCEDCQRRPSGLEGHDGIQLHEGRTLDGRQLFRCQQCGTLWTRAYEGSGVFIWLLAPDS